MVQSILLNFVLMSVGAAMALVLYRPNTKRKAKKKSIRLRILFELLFARQFYVVTDSKTAAHCDDQFLKHVHDQLDDSMKESLQARGIDLGALLERGVKKLEASRPNELRKVDGEWVRVSELNGEEADSE